MRRMKRWIALLLVLSLSVLMFACEKKKKDDSDFPVINPKEWIENEEPVQEKEDGATPLLYKVTSDNGGVLYLFGSIHVGDERNEDLPKYVMQAYEESDYLACECDVIAMQSDVALQMELAQMMLLLDQTTTADHLSSEVYNGAKRILEENGQYMPVYDMYHPAMWMSLLQNIAADNCGYSSDYGIDMLFLEDAHNEGKEIREVESARFQYEVLTGFSDELMDFMMQGYVEDMDTASKDIAKLYEMWLRGDEDGILPLLEATGFDDPSEAALYEEYELAMITERNISMAETAMDYLEEGKTGFFMVGLAHIIGDGACVERLQQAGYTVEKISP